MDNHIVFPSLEILRCYNMLQHVTTCYNMLQHVTTCYNMLQHVIIDCFHESALLLTSIDIY